MKITVHIGSTKTGSSALQLHLAQAREKLLDVGVLYPELGTKSNAHHVLFAAAHPGAWGMHKDVLSGVENERFQYFRDTFSQIEEQAVLSKVDHVVLSSEYWWGMVPEKSQKLIGECFQQHEVRLVACLRRQDRWLEASYLQAIKSGEARPFDVWLAQRLCTPTMGGAHYLRILNHWNETLLPSETCVMPYEFSDRTSYMRNVSEIVCDKNVGDIIVPSDAKVVNRSPNAEGVEAILKLNKNKDESEADRFQQMSAIMGNFSRPENSREATLLSEIEQRQLVKKFSRINKVTNRLYRSSPDGRLFKGETPPIANSIKTAL